MTQLNDANNDSILPPLENLFGDVALAPPELGSMLDVAFDLNTLDPGIDIPTNDVDLGELDNPAGNLGAVSDDDLDTYQTIGHDDDNLGEEHNGGQESVHDGDDPFAVDTHDLHHDLDDLDDPDHFGGLDHLDHLDHSFDNLDDGGDDLLGGLGHDFQ